MRLYVAGSFLRKTEAEAAMRLAVSRGHTIAHDWTVDALTEDGLTLGNLAEKCLAGVRSSDAMLVLLSPQAAGTLCEWGAAMVLGIPVVCHARNMQPWHRVVFYWHPNVWLSTDVTEAIETLEEMVHEQRAPIDAIATALEVERRG